MSTSDQAMRRILVVRLGAMGDVLHALPAVSTLHASFPEAEITWVVDPKWAVLLSGNPAVGRVVTFDRRRWGSIVAARAVLRAAEFDAALDFQGLIKSAVLARFLARCRVRYGFDRSQVREKAAAWWYDRTCVAGSAHVVERNIELAMAAGATKRCLDTPMPAGRPEGGALPTEPFVLTSPMAGWTSKQWPLEYFADLARRIAPVPLVLNGAPGAEGELREIATGEGNVRIHLSGIEGLIDATRRAAAVVGVDSGPLHLAAALGKPGVAIFGPTDPARNGPYGGTMTVLRDPRAVTTYKRGSTVSDSMRAVDAGQVATALLGIW